MSGARIVEIGEKRYWAGLEWEVIAQSEQPKNRLRELRKELGRSGIEFMRRAPDAGVTSLGYASIEKGAYRKASSLAAIVAHARREPWMGIYRIDDDLWWYIAVREGQAVIPGGDIIGTREEAEAARAEHQGIIDWRFSLEGDAADVLEMIHDGISQAKGIDKPVSSMGFHVPSWALPAGVAAIALIAGLLYLDHRRHEEMLRREAALRAERIAQMRRKLAEHAHIRGPHRPWQGMPSVRVIVDQCKHVFDRLPIERNGWYPEKLECHPNGGAILWHRAAYGLASIAPPGQIESGGNAVLESISLPRESGVSRPHQSPLNQSLLMREIYGFAQSAGLKISIEMSGNGGGHRLPGAAPALKKARKEPWRAFVISADASNLAGPNGADAIARLGRVPTMVLEKILVSGLPNHPEWKADLKVWAKR